MCVFVVCCCVSWSINAEALKSWDEECGVSFAPKPKPNETTFFSPWCCASVGQIGTPFNYNHDEFAADKKR